MDSPLSRPNSKLILGLVALGILLRTWHFSHDRSLWLDESLLALNVVGRSYAELSKPLDFDQGAPVGFLWAVKFAASLGGEGEFALRAVPLLSSLLAMSLFPLFARRFLSAAAQPIAVGLFAVLPPLIYYGAELKQYSTDVLVGMILLAVAARVVLGSRRTIHDWLALGVAGVVAPWFSHPGVFFVGGVLVCLAVVSIRERDRTAIRGCATLAAVWLFGGFVCYLVSIQELAANANLLEYWKDDFWPLGRPKWIYNKFFEIFGSPTGLTLHGIGALLFVLGMRGLWTSDRKKLALLAGPFVAALAASAMGKYPFSGRLILFLVPAIVSAIAEGAAYLRSATPQAPLVAWAAIVLLFFHPLVQAQDRLRKGPYTNPLLFGCPHEEIKPAIAHLADHWRDGDVIYVFHASQWPLRYYAPRFGLEEKPLLIGPASSDATEIDSAIVPLAGRPRVWALFSHVAGLGVDEQTPTLICLDRLGRRLEHVGGGGDCSVYLYDLSAPRVAGGPSVAETNPATLIEEPPPAPPDFVTATELNRRDTHR